MEYQSGLPLPGPAPAGARGASAERISRPQVTVPARHAVEPDHQRGGHQPPPGGGGAPAAALCVAGRDEPIGGLDRALPAAPLLGPALHGEGPQLWGMGGAATPDLEGVADAVHGRGIAVEELRQAQIRPEVVADRPGAQQRAVPLHGPRKGLAQQQRPEAVDIPPDTEPGELLRAAVEARDMAPGGRGLRALGPEPRVRGMPGGRPRGRDGGHRRQGERPRGRPPPAPPAVPCAPCLPPLGEVHVWGEALQGPQQRGQRGLGPRRRVEARPRRAGERRPEAPDLGEEALQDVRGPGLDLARVVHHLGPHHARDGGGAVKLRAQAFRIGHGGALPR